MLVNIKNGILVDKELLEDELGLSYCVAQSSISEKFRDGAFGAMHKIAFIHYLLEDDIMVNVRFTTILKRLNQTFDVAYDANHFKTELEWANSKTLKRVSERSRTQVYL